MPHRSKEPASAESSKRAPEFRNQLHAVFDANREVAKKITSDWSTKEQISTAMDHIRAMTRDDRMKYYLSNRVDDQRGWYARKAGMNRDTAFVWVCISCAAYVLAGGMTPFPNCLAELAVLAD